MKYLAAEFYMLVAVLMEQLFTAKPCVLVAGGCVYIRPTCTLSLFHGSALPEAISRPHAEPTSDFSAAWSLRASPGSVEPLGSDMVPGADSEVPGEAPAGGASGQGREGRQCWVHRQRNC